MNYYPYNDPTTLTDTIFDLYGGDANLGTSKQRQIAYWLAEEKACEDIGTFLLPTIVTGTYQFHPRIILEHTHINSVILTRFIDIEENSYWTVSGTANVYVHLDDDERGIVSIDSVSMYSACSCAYPYKVQVVYNAGIPTGVAHQHDTLLALTTLASIAMNEIIGYGNEAPGDIGIQSYSNQQYRENRIPLIRTSLGSSPRAIFANRLLMRLRKLQHVGI